MNEEEDLWKRKGGGGGGKGFLFSVFGEDARAEVAAFLPEEAARRPWNAHSLLSLSLMIFVVLFWNLAAIL